MVLPTATEVPVGVWLSLAATRFGEAQVDAGADFVGGDDMVQKIMEGWTDYDDAVIATPDMMRTWPVSSVKYWGHVV